MSNTLKAIAFGVMTTAGLSALAQPPGSGQATGLQQEADSQIQPGQGYGPGPGMRGGRRDPAQRIERMARYLELSEEQETQIKAILQEQHAKRVGLREETHKRISAILNEQQRGKLEQMRAQRGQGGAGGGRGRGGARSYGAGPGFGPGS